MLDKASTAGALLLAGLGLFLPGQLGADSGSYMQRVDSARRDYFLGLQGQRVAEARAAGQFSELESEHPSDAVVLAYSGSLELLEAARTWAVWNKHKLATDGLSKLDRAAQIAPANLEVRFIHGATTWHLPFFYHRKVQAENDFAYVAPRAEAAAAQGKLPPPIAAAALDYYGQILHDRSDEQGARTAFAAAVRVDLASPGGQDASKRLGSAD